MNLKKWLALPMLLCLVPVFAFAQDAAAPTMMAFDPTDLGSVAKLLLEAIMQKQWGIVVSLSITAVVAGLRKWVPETTALGKWFRTRLGGILTNLALSLGLAFLTLFMAGGALSADLVLKALSIALGASGGWSIVKNITEAIEESKAQKAGADAAATPPTTLDK